MASTFMTLVPSITSASTAMSALSTAFAVSPIGLVVAGVAGLTAELILLNNEANKNKTEIQKMNEVLTEYDKTMASAEKSRQKYLDTNMNELAGTEALWKELQLLVDENGKVKEGYEDRVNFILGELNGALGTEIKATDGVIEGYKGIRNSITEIIEQKRAKILLDAEEKKYNSAKDEAVKLEENYAKAQTKVNTESEKRSKYLNELIEKYGLTGTQITDLTTKYQVLDENGKVILSNFDKEVQKLQELDTNYRNANNTLTEAGNKYAENQLIIGNYEQSLKNLADGNYEAVLKMYEDTTNYQAKTSEETAKNYQGAIDSQKAYLQYLKDNKSSYDDEVYEKEKTAVEERIALLESEQKKIQEETEASQSKVKEVTKKNTSALKDIWSMSLQEQVKEMKDKKVEFKETADGNIQAYVDGQKSGAPKTKEEAKKMVTEMEKELKKSESKSKQIGKDFTSGTTQGIQQGQGSTFSAVRSYGNSILSNLKSVLGIKSPSKITRGFGKFLDEGVELGIEDGEKDTLKEVNKFGNNVIDELSKSMDFNKELEDMYKDMNRTIQMENAKLNYDVSSNDIYNKALQMPTINANFESRIPIQVDLDGEKIYENQQKVSQRKAIQYGGVR
jgi:chromosome segregation ATPase